MAIRITGMYSGLDTESIITQLASAQSVKKNNSVCLFMNTENSLFIAVVNLPVHLCDHLL